MTDKYPMITGSTLKEIRTKLGLSRRDFAAKIGISQSYLGSLELYSLHPVPKYAAEAAERLADETGN